ncbi:MAG TPA: recombination mediator RecR [Candidatus Dormibacteraeota bacterium]|nr:recombination mediator RecR [Candidatus Dormibacteraeota bacterium]
MGLLPPPVERLAEEFARFPGIGSKTAQRLAFHAVRMAPAHGLALSRAVADVVSDVATCPRCFFLSLRGELCAVCGQPGRDQTVLCVVEDPSDVLAIERSGEYRGLYHVLGAALSPLDGVGPDEIHADELLSRVAGGAIGEVILATDSDIEGEATSSYLHRRLEASGVKVTRLAHGLPVGGELAYADERTVARAFSGRQQL